ncbi:MAG: HAD family phosphatase [Candidatus Bathyarchaeota archaeon]|nr:HAD family phosphatase [Candidatus Bathyarchaeota archaeon]
MTRTQSSATLFNLTTQKQATMTIKLVIFDIDGTILQTHSWQHIHQNLGTWSQAKKHHNQFFKNQITYEQWAKLDATLWKNQSLAKINQIVNQMPYTKGAKQALNTLKQNQVKIYLLSAGLTQVAKRIQKEMGTNGYTVNTLITKNGILTGEVEVNVSFHNKDKHLPTILQKFNLTPKECAAVGDDPTLIPLFKKVALAIAFNPTNKDIEKHANITIKSNDLRDIIPHILKQR